MTVDEYKKLNTLHVELPSGLAFDCKAPSGVMVAHWDVLVSKIDVEANGLQAIDAMLLEFEPYLPDGLKVADLTIEDHAALVGIVSPFFAKSPYDLQSGSPMNSGGDIHSSESSPTNI